MRVSGCAAAPPPFCFLSYCVRHDCAIISGRSSDATGAPMLVESLNSAAWQLFGADGLEDDESHAVTSPIGA